MFFKESNTTKTQLDIFSYNYIVLLITFFCSSSFTVVVLLLLILFFNLAKRKQEKNMYFVCQYLYQYAVRAVGIRTTAGGAWMTREKYRMILIFLF